MKVERKVGREGGGRREGRERGEEGDVFLDGDDFFQS